MTVTWNSGRDDDVTQPESPTSGEILRAIGRLEKTTDSLGGKIDRLDDKLDGHANDITRHDVEIRGLRKDFNAFRDETREAAAQRGGIRGGIAAALAGGVSGALLSAALQLFVHH